MASQMTGVCMLLCPKNQLQNQLDGVANNRCVHVLSPLSAHDNSWCKHRTNVKITM